MITLTANECRISPCSRVLLGQALAENRIKAFNKVEDVDAYMVFNDNDISWCDYIIIKAYDDCAVVEYFDMSIIDDNNGHLSYDCSKHISKTLSYADISVTLYGNCPDSETTFEFIENRLEIYCYRIK